MNPSMSRNSMLTDEQRKINTRLEAHMVYICPECGKAFRTQAEWRQHLNTKHDYLKKTHADFNFIEIDEHFHECQLCFKWVENAHKTIALLQYHYFMHLDHRETYRCVHCRMAYTRRRALNDHLLSTHLREIEKYEAKLKKVDSKNISKTNDLKPTQNRNDLLEKALMDIDLQVEDPDDSTSAASSSEKEDSNPLPKSILSSNASEQALDRCLNAYEDIVRKEEEKEERDDEQERETVQYQNLKNEAELDELCKELFEEQNDEKVTTSSAQQQKEVVTIEIDAVGEEELNKLTKEMKNDEKRTKSEVEKDRDSDTSPPYSKRKRLSATSSQQDADLELSLDGITKLVSYLCPTCGMEIVSLDEWRKHVFKTHDFENFIEDSFQIKDGKSLCLQCHEVQHSTKRSELQKHCFKHLPFRSYLKCTLCDRTKTSMSRMFHHIRYNHQEELQRNNKTQLLIKSEPKWTPTKRSQKTETPEPDPQKTKEDLTCKYCNKSYKTIWRFERHALMCKVIAPKTMALRSGSATADSLLQHLREAQIRINKIWKVLQSEA